MGGSMGLNPMAMASPSISRIRLGMAVLPQNGAVAMTARIRVSEKVKAAIQASS